MARIVFAAFGSLGDVHPYLALALEMKRRGHAAVVATSACYRQKVEQLGLEYAPMRPDSTFVRDPAIMDRYMHPRWGTVRVGCEFVGPVMHQTYEDLIAASRGADEIVSHVLVGYTVRLVAEKTGVRWVSTLITPLAFFSAYDLSIVPVSPRIFSALRRLPPGALRPLLLLGKWMTRPLARPWYALRREIGLPPARHANPLLDSHSPMLELALFSALLAPRQPDWPIQTRITGFPHFDGGVASALPEALARFLADGQAPLVFTAGDSAADLAGDFFRQSIIAATQLGQRCVLVTGRTASLDIGALPDSAIVVEYAPFSGLFPKAAVIVHAGGIGSTGFAMASGRPSLVVPHAHDQFDNAARATRIGIARTLSAKRYTAARATIELRRLLEDPTFANRAAEVGQSVRNTDGVAAACDALESTLR